MRRLLIAVLCLISSAAWAQVPMTGAGKGAPSSGSTNHMSVDGTASANGSTSAVITLSTTKTNDVILVGITSNGSNATITIGDTAGLIWNLRAQSTGGAAPLKLYYAVSSGILTNDTITVSDATSAFTSATAVAVNGANTGAPFDPNGALPSIDVGGASTITTTNANTILLGVVRMVNPATPSPGSGWTNASTSGLYFLFEYQFVTSTQSGTSVTYTGTSNGSIGDAVTQ